MSSSSALRATSLLLALGLGIAGCPDPTAGTSGGQGPGAPGGPAGGPPPEGAGGPPGGEGGAPPMAGGAAGTGRPEAARFTVTDGEGVTLSGTFEYTGTKTGQLRIDFLTMDAGSPPMLAHALSLEDKGEWKVDAPKDFGDVYVVAFVDQKGDGPSADDPAGRLKDAVKIGSTDVTGLKLVLTDNADLGDLAPGTAGPPPGAGDPALAVPPDQGGKPGEGTAMPSGEGTPMPGAEGATPMPGAEGATPMPAGGAAGAPTPMPGGEGAAMPKPAEGGAMPQ